MYTGKILTDSNSKRQNSKKLQPSYEFKGSDKEDRLPPEYLVIRAKYDNDWYSLVYLLSDNPDLIHKGRVEYYVCSVAQVNSFQNQMNQLPLGQNETIMMYPARNYDLFKSICVTDPVRKDDGGLAQDTWEYVCLQRRMVEVMRDDRIIESVSALNAFNKKRPITAGGKTYNGLVTDKIPEDISPNFAANKFTITPKELVGGEDEYNRIIECVRDIVVYVKTYDLKVSITGHTDRSPTGIPSMDNKALSIKRANSLRDLMMSSVFKEMALKPENFGTIEGKGSELAERELDDEINRLNNVLIEPRKKIAESETVVKAFKEKLEDKNYLTNRSKAKKTTIEKAFSDTTEEMNKEIGRIAPIKKAFNEKTLHLESLNTRKSNPNTDKEDDVFRKITFKFS
jgi:hypothetical protein